LAAIKVLSFHLDYRLDEFALWRGAIPPLRMAGLGIA
jgi:hypothetical protein